MIDIDLAENDRLLLEAENRRRDLINLATQRFNPRLTDDPDVKVIHLYSTNDTLRKAIREMGGGKTIVVEHCLDSMRVQKKNQNEIRQEGTFLTLPKTADLVVSKSTITSAVAWLAARVQALPCVLPEATEYVLQRLDKQRVLVIVGSDQAK